MANIGDLPEGVLVELLSWVPAKDLILNCRLVCLQWRDLVDSTMLWKLKLKETTTNPKMPRSNAYYALFHLEKNLIKNPCGEEGLEFWEIQTPQEEVGKGQWEVQEVDSCDKAKMEIDFLQKNYYVRDTPRHQVNKCFAPCNGLCIKSQLITLKERGYWDQLMDGASPTIEVKDWFYDSSNCSYQLTVKLLSVDMEVIREYSYNNRDKYHWYSTRWNEISHTFYACPPGIRYILFQHHGQNVGQYEHKDRLRITKSSITIGPYSVEENDYEYGNDAYGDDSYGSSDEYDGSIW